MVPESSHNSAVMYFVRRGTWRARSLRGRHLLGLRRNIPLLSVAGVMLEKLKIGQYTEICTYAKDFSLNQVMVLNAFTSLGYRWSQDFETV